MSITAPTRPLTISTLPRLTLVNSKITSEECRTVGSIRSLESLTLQGPITDAHLAQLKSLERLSRLTVKPTWDWRRGESGSDVTISSRGVQQLRNLRRPIYLQVSTSDPKLDKAMADQFGWRFYGCSSGCCDTVPASGADGTIENGHLTRMELDGASLSDHQELQAVRLRGSHWLDHLTLDKQQMPPEAVMLCMTDYRVEHLHFRGWLPKSICLWGASRLAKITVSGVRNDARMSLRYYFLEETTALVVPSSDRIEHVSVIECDTLESLRLDGFYPNLERLDLQGVDRLRYLCTPYRGDAPRLVYPAVTNGDTSLNSLRLLKAPGSAIGGKPSSAEAESDSGPAVEVPRLPPNVVEVDLRDTPISDAWLSQLEKLPLLKTLRIGECRNLSEEAKAAFRKNRSDVQLDEKTVHRPGV